MTPVRFELSAPQSRVKHSNTEPLHSLHLGNGRTITPLLLKTSWRNVICIPTPWLCTLSCHWWVPKSAYKKLTKIWFETIVFPSQLRQFPKMISVLDKYTVFIFTSSQMIMSSYVAIWRNCVSQTLAPFLQKKIGVKKLL